MKPVIDPRKGDIEDDASSTKQRSMLSLAGSLVVEISLLKLAFAWLLLLVVPGLFLGLAPIAVTAWFRAFTDRVFSPSIGVWSILILAAIVAIGWFGGRQLLRLAESSFWSLTSIVVEPGYGACREGLRHLVERFLPSTATAAQRSALRSAAAAVAGVLVCVLAALAAIAVWPSTRLYSDFSQIPALDRVAVVTLANSVTLVAAYLAVGALVWAAFDTMMDQPRDLDAFDEPLPDDRRWRVAHLSDIHVVGERFGFRIESGRSGPRGNDRLREVFARLQEIDEAARLDLILISGDITDAGRSAEWAEFFEVLAAHPSLADRVLIIPGNHDLNIVDRANPARMELPMSPNIKLRQIRALSAMAAVQGDRAHVMDWPESSLGSTLAEAVAPHAAAMERFADVARPRLFRRFDELWASVFPMVLPPSEADGLGIILLNSNTDTHFSFTNALGVISAEEVKGIDLMRRRYPD
ncbi:metallophosphoesterase, partial [Rhizobiaceae sp. 2RAB30]